MLQGRGLGRQWLADEDENDASENRASFVACLDAEKVACANRSVTKESATDGDDEFAVRQRGARAAEFFGMIGVTNSVPVGRYDTTSVGASLRFDHGRGKHHSQ